MLTLRWLLFISCHGFPMLPYSCDSHQEAVCDFHTSTEPLM